MAEGKEEGELGAAAFGGSIEDAERAMHKGRGRMIAGMITASVLAIAAIGIYLASGDSETYGKFGQRVNGLDQQHFDQFWACTFTGYDIDRIKSDQDLRAQIHLRARNGRARFGAHVRDDCLPKLADLEPQLNSIIAPPEMQESVRSLIEAVGRLRGAFSDYIAHLDGLEDAYDPDAAADLIEPIAKAWYDYRKTLSELNKALKEKIGS